MLQQVEDIYAIYRKHPLICTDTRRIAKGAVFFALRGTDFNGNEFAEKALKSGCSYAVVDEPKYAVNDRCLLVDDALRMLQKIARHHRSLLTIPVIGITGTNGKTTTKELIRCVLGKKYKTLATAGNLNNHIGVPLTLLSITDDIEIAVIEMGANHLGEIAQLCEIAQPGFGIITNIGKAHLDGFGGPEGIIKAKSELYQYLQKNNGRAFVNADNPLLLGLTKTMDICTYGSGNHCNVTGRLYSGDGPLLFSWKGKKNTEPIENREKIKSHLVGKYNFENILAAICIGDYFNVTAADINKAIEEYIPANNRSQVIQKGSNTILMDAYNANPTSMAAAIENFYESAAEKKLLILGDMLELGAYAQEEHQHIIELLQSKKFKNVILIGPVFMKEGKGKGFKIFPGTDEAAGYLKQQKPRHTHILIKGSRGMKLETMAEIL